MDDYFDRLLKRITVCPNCNKDFEMKEDNHIEDQQYKCPHCGEVVSISYD